MAASLLAPLAYVSVLLVGMLCFSRYQRSRRKAAIATIEPWFPSHPSRDLYITLLQSQPPPPEQILMSALLARATDDVRRIWRIRDAKAALQVLLQRGSLGDETAARFAAAEKELEAEVVEVVAEANTFKQGWGQWIFASASEMASKDKLRGALREIEATRREEEQRLLARRALRGDKPVPQLLASAPSSAPASPAPAPGGATTPGLATPSKDAGGPGSIGASPLVSADNSRRGSVVSDAGTGTGESPAKAGTGSAAGTPSGTPSKSKKKGKKK